MSQKTEFQIDSKSSSYLLETAGEVGSRVAVRTTVFSHPHLYFHIYWFRNTERPWNQQFWDWRSGDLSGDIFSVFSPTLPPFHRAANALECSNNSACPRLAQHLEHLGRKLALGGAKDRHPWDSMDSHTEILQQYADPPFLSILERMSGRKSSCSILGESITGAEAWHVHIHSLSIPVTYAYKVGLKGLGLWISYTHLPDISTQSVMSIWRPFWFSIYIVSLFVIVHGNLSPKYSTFGLSHLNLLIMYLYIYIHNTYTHDI